METVKEEITTEQEWQWCLSGVEANEAEKAKSKFIN